MPGKLLAALMLAAVLAAAALMTAIWMNRVPLTDPPGLLTRLLTYLGKNVVQTSPRDPFPERRSMRLRVPATEFAERAAPLIRALGWQARADSALAFVVSTPLLGFKDDVQLSLRADASGEHWLDVRAASRLGRADLGANTRHLMALREALAAGGLVDGGRR